MASRPEPAKRADVEDFVDLRAAIERAVPLVSASYLTMLSLGLYLALTVGATTDAQLLRGSSLTLPIISVSLPIIGAYVVAPWLFVLVYLNFMFQLSSLASLCSAYESHPQAHIRKHDRALLPSILLTQSLKPVDGNRVVVVLLQLIYRATIFVLPIAFLLFTQVRFLPFHDLWITAAHQVAVLAALALMWAFWHGRIRLRANATRPGRLLQQLAVPAVVTLSVLYVAIFDAVVPRESESTSFAGEFAAEENYMLVEVATWLPSGPSLGFCARSHHLIDCVFRRYLDLRNERLAAEPPAPALLAAYLQGHGDQTQAWSDRAWLEQATPIDLSDRDLRFAVFHNAWMVKANLSGADLRGANLVGANLRQANLSNANLEGQNLSKARLQDADLSGARIRGSDLRGAELVGAKLERTLLSGADMSGAVMLGAILRRAQLQGAYLDFANLQGADLRLASLIAASVYGAQLQGADFRSAYLSAAEVTRGDLRGARLDSTLYGADFSGADLKGVNGTNLESSASNLTVAAFDGWGALEAKIKQVVPEFRIVRFDNAMRDDTARERALARLQRAAKAAKAGRGSGDAQSGQAKPMPSSAAGAGVRADASANRAQQSAFLAALPCAVARAATETADERRAAETIFANLARMYVFERIDEDEDREAAPGMAAALLDSAEVCPLLKDVTRSQLQKLKSAARR